VDARRGLRGPTRALEYAFDFGDGRPIVKGAGAEQRHDYDRPGTYTIRVTVRDQRWDTEDTFKEKVEVR
jgi:PKD repeat protein